MESNEVIQKLKNSVRQLKQLHKVSNMFSEENSEETNEKESVLIKEIVGYFDQILSNNFKIKDQLSPKSKHKDHYWTFISKHFNSSLVRFCIIYDKSEIGNVAPGENYSQKGQNWIMLSILEKTFSESIKEIYKQGLDEMYYDKNSILRKYKLDINNILNELKLINVNYKNKDYEKYLDFLSKNNNFFMDKEMSNFYSITPESPIIPNGTSPTLMFDDISVIPILKNLEIDKSHYIEQNYIDNWNTPPSKEEKVFDCQGNIEIQIVDHFYTFIPNPEKKEIKIKEEDIKNENSNDNINNNINNNISFENFNSVIGKNSDDEMNSSKFSEEGGKSSQGLILNPKIMTFLPTDNLYEINEKTSNKKYTKEDKLIYKKKKRQMTNCFLLYLNNFYKKTPYHKFYKHNLHNRPISLKEQNYQCYICLHKFSCIFGVPTEQIYWCSYYMRFICKNCIDSEYSIIPYFVLEKWCFKKFPISKQAKATLVEWYDKPIIYFKKYDNLIRKIPQLNKVIEIKKIINNIFDKMKCENKFQFLKDNLGDYEYIVLKENLFSMRDLAEINKKSFYKKIKGFKNKFVKHIREECPVCYFDGEICAKCGYNQKIFFYDTDNVFYCKICKRSFHKRCIGLVGHVH